MQAPATEDLDPPAVDVGVHAPHSAPAGGPGGRRGAGPARARPPRAELRERELAVVADVPLAECPGDPFLAREHPRLVAEVGRARVGGLRVGEDGAGARTRAAGELHGL